MLVFRAIAKKNQPEKFLEHLPNMIFAFVIERGSRLQGFTTYWNLI